MLAKIKQFFLRKGMQILAKQPHHKTLPTNIERIALWQFGGVGDMLLATPVIMALEKKFPKAKIYIWCSNPPFAQFLLQFHNVVSIQQLKVYDFDMRTIMKGNVRKTLRAIHNDMRKNQAELIVNLHVPALLDWWAIEWWLLHQLKPRYAWGIDPTFMKHTSIFNVSLNAKLRDNQHYTQLYQQLLEKAQVPCSLITYFPTTDKDRAMVHNILMQAGIQDKQRWACLHIGARRLKVENKMWPMTSFAALSHKLLKNSILPVLIGVESEKALGEELCHTEPHVINLIGKTNMGEMASIISAANVFIGHDSGPFHVAIAVNTPALAICGRPDAEAEYLKYDKGDVTVLTADTPQQIGVDEVMQHAKEMVDSA